MTNHCSDFQVYKLIAEPKCSSISHRAGDRRNDTEQAVKLHATLSGSALASKPRMVIPEALHH